jgi:hypothetical protein
MVKWVVVSFKSKTQGKDRRQREYENAPSLRGVLVDEKFRLAFASLFYAG